MVALSFKELPRLIIVWKLFCRKGWITEPDPITSHPDIGMGTKLGGLYFHKNGDPWCRIAPSIKEVERLTLFVFLRHSL
jgi:hypothetical protein